MVSSNNTVLIQVRHKYGRVLIYPMNERAKLFTKLTGRLTLLESDVRLIKDLGFAIEYLPESLEDIEHKRSKNA